jgi:hypothetical protein
VNLIILISSLLWAAPLEHVDRGYADFDRVCIEVSEHGQWSPHDSYRFIFTPKKPRENWRPYREGQWLYTDHGWTWRGAERWAWATDHFGFWTKRNVDGWAWVPGDFWLPATVEWIQSGDYVGWRASILDRFSNMEESDSLRYANADEWNFIPREKLYQKLTPADFASDEKAAELLAERQPCDHIYVAWREIPRPGPAVKIEDETTGERIPIPVVHNLTSPNQEFQDSETAIFFYRPRFYQDGDGIFRRISAMLTAPKPAKETEKEIVKTAVVGDEQRRELTRAEREAQWKKMERAHQKEKDRWERLRR